MLVEAISFKLTVNFFEYLRKNRIGATSIKVAFFDRKKTKYLNFVSLSELKAFFVKNYTVFDRCQLGEFVSIQSFEVESTLFRFATSYRVIDPLGNLKITQGIDFSRGVAEIRNTLQNRQRQRIEGLVRQYRAFSAEILDIYTTGIFSPCYAIPGWSEGTGRLEELRKTLINTDRAFR